MILYSVRMTASANRQIIEYTDYITEQSKSTKVAEQWSQKIYQKIATLNIHPKRYAFAQENDHRDYEIRRQLIGNYVVLYTIDDAAMVVKVIGFRHAKQLSITSVLPTGAD